MRVFERYFQMETSLDQIDKYEVNLLSRKTKIDLNKTFIDKINELNHLKLEIKSEK